MVDLQTFVGRKPEEIEWALSLTPEQRLLAETVGVHPGIGCDATGQCPIIGYRYSIERPVTVPIPANAPKENNTYDLCQEAFDQLPKEDQKMYTKMNAPVKWLPPNTAAAQTVSEGKAEEWLPPELDEYPGGSGCRRSTKPTHPSMPKTAEERVGDWPSNNTVMLHAPREELQRLVDVALAGAKKAREEAVRAHDEAKRCRKETNAANEARRKAEAKCTKMLLNLRMNGRCCAECGGKLDARLLMCEGCRVATDEASKAAKDERSVGERFMDLPGGAPSSAAPAALGGGPKVISLSLRPAAEEDLGAIDGEM